MQATICNKSVAKTTLQPAEEQLIALWLRQQPSENTRGAYARDLRRLFQFVKKPMCRIAALDLIEFSDHLFSVGLAPISRARTLTAVRSFLRFAHRAGLLKEDLADSIRLPRYDNLPEVELLRLEDVHESFVCVRRWLWTAVLTILSTVPPGTTSEVPEYF
jgi:site-specific recombinase XerD